MIEVLGRATSSNVQKVLWTLRELGLEYRRCDLGGAFGGLDTPEYRAMNPNGKVPTLIDDDLVLWESNAIVRYLAARYDPGGLWPQDAGDRALADLWMDWQQTVLFPPWVAVFFGVWRTPQRYRDEEANARAVARLNDAYALLDRQLQGRAFVAGRQLTIADIPAGMTLYRYYTMEIERPSLPAIEAWYARLRQRAAYRETVMTDFGSLKDTLIPDSAASP